MDIIINISIAIASGAGGAGIIYLIAKTSITEKIKGKIKSDYDHQIEDFKAELKGRYDMKLESFRSNINTQSILINTVSSAQKDAYSAYNNERSVAIKIYWSYYVDITSKLYGLFEIDRNLVKDEHELFLQDAHPEGKIHDIMKNIKKPEIWSADPQFMDVIKLTPFLSMELLRLIRGLQLFLGRICQLYSTNYEKGQLRHWTTDELAVQNLSLLISLDELKYVTNLKRGSLIGSKSVVEMKVLSEIYKITNGKSGSEYSSEHITQLIESLKQPPE